jgi:hypothetical protein
MRKLGARSRYLRDRLGGFEEGFLSYLGQRYSNDSQNAYVDLLLVLDHCASDSMGCWILLHAVSLVVSLTKYYLAAILWLTGVQPTVNGCKSRGLR